MQFLKWNQSEIVLKCIMFFVKPYMRLTFLVFCLWSALVCGGWSAQEKLVGDWGRCWGVTSYAKRRKTSLVCASPARLSLLWRKTVMQNLGRTTLKPRHSAIEKNIFMPLRAHIHRDCKMFMIKCGHSGCHLSKRSVVSCLLRTSISVCSWETFPRSWETSRAWPALKLKEKCRGGKFKLYKISD